MHAYDASLQRLTTQRNAMHKHGEHTTLSASSTPMLTTLISDGEIFASCPPSVTGEYK